MSAPTCQTCYSELSQSARPYLTPCCDSPICDRCISLNPRLREYNPCLRCGDVRSVAGSSRVRIGDKATEDRERQEERDQFQIGVDEGDEEDDLQNQTEEGSRPPSYTEPDAPSTEVEAGNTPSGEPAEVEMEVVEVTHPISRGDTLSSIARRYAADPHDLLTLNNLPPAALHTNPRLIQTRSILIISRRLIPQGTIPSSSSLTTSSLSPEEAEKRESERRLKRFQLLTKTTDPGVGKAYLALADQEAERHVLEDGSGEVLDKEGGGGGKKVLGKGGKEGRALEAYYEDEEWETEVGGARRVKEGGRWVVVGRGIGAGSSGMGMGLKA